MQEYTTVSAIACDMFTEKRSVFNTAISPVLTEEEAVQFIAAKKAEFWDSTSVIYAYTLVEGNISRYSDGGEPKGTGGIPVLGVINKHDLKNVCIVVNRVYGGTPLGAGGLVRAFTKAATLAISAAEKVVISPRSTVELSFEYTHYNAVLKIVEQYDTVTKSCDFSDSVLLTLSVKDDEMDEMWGKLFDTLYGRIEKVVTSDY